MKREFPRRKKARRRSTASSRTSELIVERLRSGPATTDDLVSLTGLKPNSVSRAISRLNETLKAKGWRISSLIIEGEWRYALDASG